MAGRGPAPKPTRQRQRDEPELTELVAVPGAVYGDPLPLGVLPDDEPWHPQTVVFWDSLRTSPLLANEPALGWQFLVDTALMHHTMWSKGKWEFASEVRLRVAKFGATPEDRMRLKIKVGPAKPAAVASSGNVRSINSRRAILDEE